MQSEMILQLSQNDLNELRRAVVKIILNYLVETKSNHEVCISIIIIDIEISYITVGT